MTSDPIKYGLVVSVSGEQIAVMGAHGGEPTLFTPKIHFKVISCFVSLLKKTASRNRPLPVYILDWSFSLYAYTECESDVVKVCR